MNKFGGYIIGIGALFAITELIVLLTIRFTAFDLLGLAGSLGMIYLVLYMQKINRLL